MHPRSDGLNSHQKNHYSALQSLRQTGSGSGDARHHPNPRQPNLLNSTPPHPKPQLQASLLLMRGSGEHSPDVPVPHTPGPARAAPTGAPSHPCSRQGDGHEAASSLPPFPGSLIRAFLGKTILFQTQKFYF